MDFVKREDQSGLDEESYKVYLDSLQKSHQMEVEYQHTPISMEQLLNATTLVHNLPLSLSPRQMSTLMLKTNLTRGLAFNEIPAHLSRNLANELDLVQNLTQEQPQNLGRHEDVISQQISRNLDINLARNLTNDLETQNLVQNLTEQDLTRNLSSDLSRIIDVMPQNLRADIPHDLDHEIDLSHHMNRTNIQQEILSHESRRTPMIVMQESHLMEQSLVPQNLGQRLDQRLVSGISMQETQRQLEQGDHLIPMPFHIKSEQEDDGYFYDNMNQGLGNVNGLNGHIPIHPEHSQPASNLHQDSQLYVYNNHTIPNLPALNPIDLYSRPQNYNVQNYENNREDPQNLVVHRQFDNQSPYQKFRHDDDQNAAKNNTKEQPKENLKPTNQNKIFYPPEFAGQAVYDESSVDNKLIITEESMIKGEYVCYKCNEIFPTKRGLKQHMRSCTENGDIVDEDKLGKFICTQCSYRCQSPAILKIHERTHTGEKPFSCTFCDYKSGQKNNVAKHILVHMKEKPFRCQYCDYRCAQKNNLVVHERTHTGYKPFACPYCDYRTVQKPNLVKHMYLHTDQKPFSCDICSYRCVQKTNLTKHKQRHLNEKDGDKFEVKSQTKPYRPRQKSVKCPHCTYRCVQKSSLEKHMQFKHCEQAFVEDNSELIDENQCETIHNLSVKKDGLNECQPLQIQS